MSEDYDHDPGQQTTEIDFSIKASKAACLADSFETIGEILKSQGLLADISVQKNQYGAWDDERCTIIWTVTMVVKREGGE